MSAEDLVILCGIGIVALLWLACLRRQAGWPV
jgi:hypothetical protein